MALKRQRLCIKRNILFAISLALNCTRYRPLVSGQSAKWRANAKCQARFKHRATVQPRLSGLVGTKRNSQIRQHLIVKQHFYKSFERQYGLLCILNHSILSQSELIRVFFISYDARERCFCSLKQNKLALDCTFQCYRFKKNIASNLDHH